MNARPLIDMDRVSKVYGNGTVALQEMSLAAQQGEFITLVGASGCGKSTVLRLAAGLIEPSTGRVQWSEDDWRKKLAFVFQEAALMPWASLLENVRLPLKLAGVPQRKSRNLVQETLHRVGLNGFEKSYPRQLSGGMKMRASLARALVTQPEILLMDEPFGALDEMTRSKLNRDLLELWQQQQWTVLFVTHNLYEAVYLSKRVVVMAANPGRVLTEIEIDAPYPRTEEFRTSRLYNEYCREVFACLQETASPVLT